MLLFRIVRSSVGLIRRIKFMKTWSTKSINSSDKQRIDNMNRSMSIVLQTMALNMLSLVVAISVTLFWIWNSAGILGQFSGVTYCTALFGNTCYCPTDHSTMLCRYTLVATPVFTLLNSNLGFLVHCYYSNAYRKAAVDVVLSVKNTLAQFCSIKYKRIAWNREVALTPSKSQTGPISTTK
jgi:hypothetical protein